MPEPTIFSAPEVSVEQTQRDLIALQHSVNLIETLINSPAPTEGPYSDETERKDAIRRNAAHIRVMLSKPHIQSSNGNLQALEQAAVLAEQYTASV